MPTPVLMILRSLEIWTHPLSSGLPAAPATGLLSPALNSVNLRDKDSGTVNLQQMRNIWVSLQWIFFSRVRRVPRTIVEDLFHFDFFRLFVWEGIRKKTQIRYFCDGSSEFQLIGV
jgi:hypothetical protein